MNPLFSNVVAAFITFAEKRQMYAKEFPCSWFLEDRIRIYKEKEKLVVAYLRPPQNMKLGNVQWRERNVQKSVMHVQSCFTYLRASLQGERVTFVLGVLP